MTEKKQVAGALLCHPDGRLLLHLRDDKPDIPDPNRWALVGGHMEAGETPEEAMLREVEEEIGFIPRRYHLFTIMHKTTVTYHFFLAEIDVPLESLTLTEGQAIDYYDLEQALGTLNLGSTARPLLEMLRIYRRYRLEQGLTTLLDAS